jgi:diguanylate cyclase (GGDEF)-like protein
VLPDGIADLLFRRIDQVGPTERSVLTVAAAAGSPFDLTLLRRVVSVEAGVVDQTIARAVEASLVEHRPGGRAAFVHECIAEALLAALDPDADRAIHQRLAEVADTGDLDGDALFFVARHYRLGQLWATPARTVELGRGAGAAALEMHAAREALDYLEAAHQVAESHGVEVDAAFEQELATSYLRSGQSEVAGEHFGRSIELTTDPWVRAAARAQLGRIDFLEGRYDQSDAHVDTALREIGRPVPRSGVLAVVVSAVHALASTIVSRLRRTTATADVGERHRLAVLISLYDTGGSSSYMRREPLGMIAFALYGLGPGIRLGMSPQYLRGQSSLCTLAAILHRRRAAARAIPRLQAMARDLGNPSVMATVAMNATVATEFLGDTVRAAELGRMTITEFGRWMEPGELQMLISLVVVNLGIRGHHAEAASLLELQARQPARIDDARQETLDSMRGISANSMGRSDPTGNGIAHYVERVGQFQDRSQRLNLLGSLVAWSLELGPPDDVFDRLVDMRDREHVRMLTASHYDRIFWVDKAYGRVAQWRAAVAGGADRIEVARRRSKARVAVRQARRAAFGMHQPFLHAEAMMARAMSTRLDGHTDRALRLMARVELAAVELDAPSLRLDVWCERARVLADRGLRTEADAEIGLALTLTASQGWGLRQRNISAEFPHVGPYGGSNASSTSSRSATRVERSGSESTPTSLSARRLDALLQVSVAAANVIDPLQLARIALDEALTILGAERAFLFLADAEEDMSFFVGRDGSSQDLNEAVGYSTTAVEQVRASRQALVVTGSDEGALIGSTSAVVHGLRSILVAPLLLESRLTGVVYLDSRLAKGMFTGADVDILVAIATQVAVSLETARSAQLEMLVHAEREQRALVDTLRDIMAEMAATLDPGEVLDRLLAGLARAVPFDAASVVVLDDDSGRAGHILSVAGRTAPAGPDGDPVVGNLPPPAIMESLRSGQAVLDPDAAAQPPGAVADFVVGSWMAVPLELSEKTLASVVVAASSPFGYGETQLEIVRTVVAHGTVAYQNARLFTANRVLAVTDELSGLGNRRNFFELATERLDAREGGQGLSLLMVDIDHFKYVNDTFGHPTGDDVIREVAERLRSVARVGDVVGRYGGEEFALLLSATPETALVVAERLRSAVADEPVVTRSGALHVTVSVGVTHVTIDDRSLEDLLSRADGGLYEAKKGGRNLVVRR